MIVGFSRIMDGLWSCLASVLSHYASSTTSHARYRSFTSSRHSQSNYTLAFTPPSLTLYLHTRPLTTFSSHLSLICRYLVFPLLSLLFLVHSIGNHIGRIAQRRRMENVFLYPNRDLRLCLPRNSCVNVGWGKRSTALFASQHP
jgi:hypothetical protein